MILMSSLSFVLWVMICNSLIIDHLCRQVNTGWQILGVLGVPINSVFFIRYWYFFDQIWGELLSVPVQCIYFLIDSQCIYRNWKLVAILDLVLGNQVLGNLRFLLWEIVCFLSTIMKSSIFLLLNQNTSRSWSWDESVPSSFLVFTTTTI